METIEKSARIISLNAMPPKEGKTMYKLIDGDNMLLLLPDVYELCKTKEVSKVIFKEDGSLVIDNKETGDSKTFKTFKVSDVVDSELTVIAEQTEQLKKATALEMAKLHSEFEVKLERTSYDKKLKELGKALV